MRDNVRGRTRAEVDRNTKGNSQRRDEGEGSERPHQLKSLSRQRVELSSKVKKLSPIEKKSVLPRIPRKVGETGEKTDKGTGNTSMYRQATVAAIPRQKHQGGEMGGRQTTITGLSRQKREKGNTCTNFMIDNSNYARFSRTNTLEELPPTKFKKRESIAEEPKTVTKQESPVKCYEAGQILEETRQKMWAIDRRNSDLKARRESIHYSVEKKTLNLIDTEDTPTPPTPPQPETPQATRDRRSESIKPVSRRKLPPISRHAHSFNEFDHKRLSRQASHASDKSGSGSQTSLRDGSRRRCSSEERSMFTLKSKSRAREAVGIVSHVTGDLSVKLTKVKPIGLQGLNKGGLDIEEYLSQLSELPRAERGTRKLRPLSTDIRVERENQLRRTKSSTPAMVLCSLKPDVSSYLKNQKSVGNVIDTKPSRSNFQRAVMAVTATNRIRSTKIWRV